MNPSLQRLGQIANKSQKRIIGLMSGTSLDGLDIAVCEIENNGYDTKIELVCFETVAYPPDVRERLKKIMSVPEVDAQELCLMHSWLGNYHGDLILESLRKWDVKPEEIDCIASHGQTVYHAPRIQHKQHEMPNGTLQIGDGDHVARRTGILTLSDFRQKHTAAGGEGAPMVSYGDRLLFTDRQFDRLLLNIGGIANFTYLPALESEEDPVTTDTGPGNTLINTAMEKLYDLPYDEGGEIASRGTVNAQLVRQVKEDDFFNKTMPKTTGQEKFNFTWVQSRIEKSGIEEVPDEDLIATLTWFSAETIADAIREVCGDQLPEIYLSGGGMHNSQLVDWISELLDSHPLHSFEEIGFNPDAKEAVLFALLANETLSGKGFFMDPKQNAGRRVNFGKISLPV